MFKFLNTIKGDKVIWIVVIILSIFSILAVYSSTGTLAYRYRSGNTEYYLFKQFIILIFGILLMYGAHLIKYTYYSRISQIALVIAIPLLFLTFIMGTDVNQANRWLTLPIINLSFQSSDFAKLALIMYIARLLSIKQQNVDNFKKIIVSIMLPIFIVCGLILPANFSTAAVLFTTCLVLLFIGRIKFKYIFSLIGIGVTFLLIFLLILYASPNQGRLGTWKSRVESFTNGSTEDNYQVEHAKIAIATGGIVGKKPGNSTQKNFLPQPYSDFIFAIIIEEYGLIGGSIVVLMYMILLFRGVRIATRIDSFFGSFLTIGCCFSLVFQAMINMAVAVNILPVTGQPLPLVSMGGTSTWFTGITIGIILSVSRETEQDIQTEDENKDNVSE